MSELCRLLFSGSKAVDECKDILAQTGKVLSNKSKIAEIKSIPTKIKYAYGFVVALLFVIIAMLAALIYQHY